MLDCIVLTGKVIDNYRKIVSQSEFLAIIHITRRIRNGQCELSLNELSKEMGYESNILYQMVRELSDKKLIIVTGDNGRAMKYDTSPFFSKIEEIATQKEVLQVGFDLPEASPDKIVISDFTIEHTNIKKWATVYYLGNNHLYLATVLKVNAKTIKVSIPSLDKVTDAKPDKILVKQSDGTYAKLILGEVKQASKDYKPIVEKLYQMIGVNPKNVINLSMDGSVEKSVFNSASEFDALSKSQNFDPVTVLDNYFVWYTKKYGKNHFRNIYELKGERWVEYQQSLAIS